jgi:hypothetical protein
VSEFNEIVDYLKKYHEGNYDALLNKSVKKWSTTPYSDYQSMLKELGDTTDLNQELGTLYTQSRTDKSARNWAKSSGYELQLQFMNSVKASLRRKFVQTAEDKELSKLAYDRYNANECKEAIAILERLQQFLNTRVT